MSMRSGRNQHPAQYARTRPVIASMGLTPGLPIQFAYVEYEDHPTMSSEDKANYFINDECYIRQNSQKFPITGERAFIYDIPFDPIADKRTNDRLAILGLAMAAMGGLLYI